MARGAGRVACECSCASAEWVPPQWVVRTTLNNVLLVYFNMRIQENSTLSSLNHHGFSGSRGASNTHQLTCVMYTMQALCSTLQHGATLCNTVPLAPAPRDVAVAVVSSNDI